MPEPLFGARWPWVTRRRFAWLTLLAVGAGSAIVWHHRSAERAFLAQLEVALPTSVALSADAIGEWVMVRRAHARTLAAVASAAPRGQPAIDAIRTVLPVFVAEGGFRDGRVEAHFIDRAPALLHTIAPADAEQASQVEFRGLIARAGTPNEAVVLRTVLTEDAFSHFNVAAPDDRTQRTALLLAPDADHLDLPQLLVASAPGGGPRARATRSLAEGITREQFSRATYVVDSAARLRGHGLGRGLTGAQVVFAIAPIAGTPWLLLRERQVDELTALLAPSLLVTDAVFAVLTALVIGVLLLRWRAEHQRRESAAVQLRATFVASISHELRTPLTQVRMYAEMLRLGLLAGADDRARALSVIEKEAERLTLLIERALAFVRTGQAVPPPPQESVLVALAVTRAFEAIAALAEERQMTLRYDVDATLSVRMIRDDLHQVLLNLLDNAIKYGPVGQTIEVMANAVDGVVRVSVRDQGAGVPVVERESIWQPFRRGQAAAASSANGSGIGLVVVRDLVARSGGRAFVDARTPTRDRTAVGVSETGSVFVLELPRGD